MLFPVKSQARILQGQPAMQENINSKHLWHELGFVLPEHDNYRRLAHLAAKSKPDTDKIVPGGPDHEHHF